jgi:hypothetical protein
VKAREAEVEVIWQRRRTEVLPAPGQFVLSRCSSGVEHFLGKEEVSGSIPDNGSRAEREKGKGKRERIRRKIREGIRGEDD